MGSSDIREPVCRLGPYAPATAAAIVVARRLGQRGRRLLGTCWCWLVIAPPPNDDPTPTQSAAARQPRSHGLADRLFAVTKVAPFVIVVVVVFSAKGGFGPSANTASFRIGGGSSRVGGGFVWSCYWAA